MRLYIELCLRAREIRYEFLAKTRNRWVNISIIKKYLTFVLIRLKITNDLVDNWAALTHLKKITNDEELPIEEI